MGVVTAVLSGRDWLLNRVAQVDPGYVLNNNGLVVDHPVPGVELAANLKRLMNDLKAEAFVDNGHAVNYRLLQESASYAEYRACTQQLRTFDPQMLSTVQQKRAF